MKISKTTVSGYLSLVITIGVYFTVNPPPGVSPKTIGLLTMAVGVAKAINGHLMQDAGQIPANVGGKIEDVPSHETPDDPALADKVVKQ